MASLLWSLWLARNDLLFNHNQVDSNAFLLLTNARSFEWCVIANIIPHDSINQWAIIPGATAENFLKYAKGEFLSSLISHYEILVFVKALSLQACNLVAGM